MPSCRFEHRKVIRYGLIENVHGATAITRTLPSAPSSFDDFEHGEGTEIPLDAVRLLAPAEPSKIVCIGRNYREHAKELNHPAPTEPLIFLKPPSSVIGTGHEIGRPNSLSQRVDYEGEWSHGSPSAAIACPRATMFDRYSWLYLHQRRDRARLTAKGRAMDASERVRIHSAQ